MKVVMSERGIFLQNEALLKEKDSVFADETPEQLQLESSKTRNHAEAKIGVDPPRHQIAEKRQPAVLR
jgi:hypothetical protein